MRAVIVGPGRLMFGVACRVAEAGWIVVGVLVVGGSLAVMGFAQGVEMGRQWWRS